MGRREQLELGLPAPRPGRGGARPGAGRPRVRPLPPGWREGRRFVPHLRREAIDRRSPAHVTLRVVPVARSLRTRTLHRVLREAFGRCEKPDFRLVHYAVLRDHLHLVVEADGPSGLARGMQGLAIRVARGLNRALGRRGRVFADRYHARVLRSPTETRNALRYVMGNARHHGLRVHAIDPFSSAADLPGLTRIVLPEELFPRCTAEPRSWLLRVGWRRGRRAGRGAGCAAGHEGAGV